MAATEVASELLRFDQFDPQLMSATVQGVSQQADVVVFRRWNARGKLSSALRGYPDCIERHGGLAGANSVSSWVRL